ncbi:MAG: hypothetical protein AAGA86_03000 [Bacteroidota bacterium]
MPGLQVTPENQIQRLNHIFNQVAHLQKLEPEVLYHRPRSKAWNVLEILEHLSIAYSFYREKLETTLETSPKGVNGTWVFKVRPWQHFVLEGQRPKGKKRPFKIKTLKRFVPYLQGESGSATQVQVTFNRFHDAYGHLKDQILDSRIKKVGLQKVSSAIGPIVRFYLPEAFEFLICHAERHMVQIEETLAKDQEMGYL